MEKKLNNPAGIYLFKCINEKTKGTFKICSKQQRHQDNVKAVLQKQKPKFVDNFRKKLNQSCSGVFIATFELIYCSSVSLIEFERLEFFFLFVENLLRLDDERLKILSPHSFLKISGRVSFLPFSILCQLKGHSYLQKPAAESMK